MKRILSTFLALLFATIAFGADAANDFIFTQRKTDNSGNIQRNIPATGAATSAATFRSTLGIPGLTDNNTFSGTNSFTGGGTFTAPFSPVPTAMPALAVDVTKAVNTYSATGDVTFTYSATPAAGTRTLVRITADSSARTITIPSTWSLIRGANITSLAVPANTTLEVLLQYVTSPSARWEIIGDPAPTLAISGGGTGATTGYGAYDAISGPETSVSIVANSAAIGGAATNKVTLGAGTINSFDSVASGIQRWIRFTGAGTLTYNASSMILPGAVNLTYASGDVALVVSLGSGNWVLYQYQPALSIAPAIICIACDFLSGTPAAATTYWNGRGTGLAWSGLTNQGRYRYPVPYNGTIIGVQYAYNAGGSADNTHAVTVDAWYDNTSSACTSNFFMQAAATTGTIVTTNQLAVTANHYIEGRVKYATGFTGPTGVSMTVFIYIRFAPTF